MGRCFALIMRASWFHAHSPCSAAPSIRFFPLKGGPRCSSARSFAPRFLPIIGHPHAVALRFVRCDQLTAGLLPARVRPCWAHKEKRVRSFLIRPVKCFRYSGAPGAIRTPDPLVRSQVLYPAELRARCNNEDAHYIDYWGALQVFYKENYCPVLWSQ